MKITNKFDLPEQIVRAVSTGQRRPEGKNISVTGLIGPAWKRKLELENWESLTEDASGRLWSLFGQSVHWYLEKHSGPIDISEERLYADIGGWKISGQADNYNPETGIIEDWKTTSVWTVIYGSRTSEWAQQLNCYAHLWRLNGFVVKSLKAVLILRDWKESEALKGGGYPEIPFVQLPLPLWKSEKAEDFILQRLGAHESPGLCTREERWARADKYAVKKEGRKTAVKVCDSLEEAEKFMGGFKAPEPYSIELRPGEDVRCKKYCGVRIYCEHGKTQNN